MNERIPVLDHGYVQLVEHMGSDERIIESARMSTGKGFLGWGPLPCPECVGTEHDPSCCGLQGLGCSCRPQRDCLRCSSLGQIAGDEKLLRFLWEKKHSTPFETGEALFEVQAPIFVFREWHRHRTQSYNERSSRYAPLPDVNYLPSVDRIKLDGGRNKQAQGVTGLERQDPWWFREALQHIYLASEQTYQAALDSGIPKELARLCLPVARYSTMRAKANLRNWLGFLALRMDASAQWEIRQYAFAIHGELSMIFPRTLALFDEGRR